MILIEASVSVYVCFLQTYIADHRCEWFIERELRKRLRNSRFASFILVVNLLDQVDEKLNVWIIKTKCMKKNLTLGSYPYVFNVSSS